MFVSFSLEILTGMGYNKADIEESLKTQKYDDIFATYLLLGRRSSDVSSSLLRQTNKKQKKKIYMPLELIFKEKSKPVQEAQGKEI